MTSADPWRWLVSLAIAMAGCERRSEHEQLNQRTRSDSEPTVADASVPETTDVVSRPVDPVRQGTGCSTLTQFRAEIEPLVTSYCLGCHQPGGAGAWVMTLVPPSESDAASLHLVAFSTRLNHSNAPASVLLAKAGGTVPHGPNVDPVLAGGDLAALLTWAESEGACHLEGASEDPTEAQTTTQTEPPTAVPMATPTSMTTAMETSVATSPQTGIQTGCILPTAVNYEDHIEPMIATYCVSCHGSTSSLLDLSSYLPSGGSVNPADQWQLVWSRLQNGSMPPLGSPGPTVCENEVFGMWIAQGVPELPGSSPPAGEQSCEGREPDATNTRLLTKAEYTRSIEAIFAGFDLQGDAGVANAIAVIAPSPDQEQFEQLAFNLTPANVESFFKAGYQIATFLTATVARRQALLGACDSTNLAALDTCVSSFIVQYGRRIFRRPLATEEVDRYLGLYQTTRTTNATAGLRAVIAGLLNAPRFLYKLEIDGDEVGPGLFRVDSYEFAARIAFALTGKAPDDLLLAAAGSGGLEQLQDVVGQIERIFVAEATWDHWAEFYHRWLMLEHKGGNNFTQEFLADATPVNMEVALVSFDNFLKYVMFQSDGSYRDLLLSRSAFVTDPDLAHIYGVSSNAAGNTLPAEYAGILTRYPVAFGPNNMTSPILRGKMVRTKILCDDLPLPDPNALPAGSLDPPLIDGTKTSREVWTEKTSPAACQGCHNRINPLGFALDDVDALGRFRRLEKIFFTDVTGMDRVVSLPLDTVVDPQIASPGETVGGSVGLSQAIAESRKGHECFARQLYRVSSGRFESEGDRCLINEVTSASLEGGVSVRGMMTKIMTSEEFRLRKID